MSAQALLPRRRHSISCCRSIDWLHFTAPCSGRNRQWSTFARFLEPRDFRVFQHEVIPDLSQTVARIQLSGTAARPTHAVFRNMKSGNGILCRTGRIVEADIDLRGGSDGLGRSRGRGRFSDPEAISVYMRSKAPGAVRIGLETGPTSTWLWTELKQLGLPVICIDAPCQGCAQDQQKRTANDAIQDRPARYADRPRSGRCWQPGATGQDQARSREPVRGLLKNLGLLRASRGVDRGPSGADMRSHRCSKRAMPSGSRSAN